MTQPPSYQGQWPSGQSRATTGPQRGEQLGMVLPQTRKDFWSHQLLQRPAMDRRRHNCRRAFHLAPDDDRGRQKPSTRRSQCPVLLTGDTIASPYLLNGVDAPLNHRVHQGAVKAVCVGHYHMEFSCIHRETPRPRGQRDSGP